MKTGQFVSRADFHPEPERTETQDHVFELDAWDGNEPSRRTVDGTPRAGMENLLYGCLVMLDADDNQRWAVESNAADCRCHLVESCPSRNRCQCTFLQRRKESQ